MSWQNTIASIAFGIFILGGTAFVTLNLYHRSNGDDLPTILAVAVGGGILFGIMSRIKR